MKIYNYLFYKTYLLTQRSGNFDDAPALGGLVFVVTCLMFNIFSIALFLEGIGFLDGYPFKEKYKFPFVFGLLILVLIYYLYKGRYKKIVEHYEQKKDGIKLRPIFVVIIYYGISIFLMFLAATFKNHDWIFAK